MGTLSLGYSTIVELWDSYIMRVSYSGNTSGFQPDDRGSIPLTRSTQLKDYQRHSFLTVTGNVARCFFDQVCDTFYVSKEKLVSLSVMVVVTVGFLVWGAFGIWQSSKKAQKPESASESSFLLNEIYYDCSRLIDGDWVEARVGQLGEPGYYFKPSNQEDFEKYCRAGAVIEYRAVLDILRRDDVYQLIAKYNTSEAWVRALGHRYINDKNYLTRILPAYSNLKIDCVIVVHSPEGTRFFIENSERHENHEDHQYLEIPTATFLTSLNRASDEDVTNFWLGLH